MEITKKVLFRSLLVNILLVFLKMSVGFLGNFKALVADGIHSLSDLSTDVIALLGNRLAKRPADEEHPFGHGKVQYLTSILIGIIIMVLAFMLVFKAFNVGNMVASYAVFYVTIVTIILKYFLSRYILKMGYLHNDNILIASGKESRADVLSTLVVILAFWGAQFSKYNQLFIYSDFVGTIIVALFIFYTGYGILKENIISIIGARENDSNYLDNITKIILSDDRIVKIDELEVMKYGYYYQVNLALSLLPDYTIKEFADITKILKNKLINEKTKIAYIKVSVNPYGGE